MLQHSLREPIENYLQHADYGIEIETVHTLGWETGGDLKTIITSKEINNVIVAYGDIVSK